MWALPTALPVGNTSPRLSHASDRLDPSYTRTCTCTRQRPRARRRARTTFPGETLCVQRCVTLQRLLACARAWYQSSAISVTFRTLSRVSRGDLWKVPREGTFNSTVRPSKGRCSPVAAWGGLGRSGTGDRDFMELLHGRAVAMLVCEYDLSMGVYWRVFGTLLQISAPCKQTPLRLAACIA